MRFWKKTISIILVHAFLLSSLPVGTLQSAIAATQEPSVSKEITTTPDSVVISRDDGIVKSRFTGSSGKLIIHIQDAHCNYEAQSNIAKIIEGLIKNNALTFVSVEGADGLIDTSWFKSFPDAEVRKEVANYFMKKGEITGPEFLSITTDYPIKLFGAETREYYIQNLNAFMESYPLKAEIEKYLNQIKTALNRLQGLIYNADLKAMDSKYRDYEAKTLQFNEYVRFLQAEAEKHKINLRQYDNLFKLVNVLVYEKKIDFNVTDRERSALIDEISKAVVKDVLTELVNQSIAFKVGKISSVEYYGYVRSLALKNEIDLSKKYPNLYNYIIYNSVYSRIENEQLFGDIKKLESAIKEKLFENDDQRTLERLSRHIDTLIGLINIKLLNDEFEYYKTHREEFALEAFTDFIKAKSIQFALAYEILPPEEAISTGISKLDDFYVIAIKRDRALVENTLEGMDKSGQKIAVLVTGGFHSEGMAKLLQEKGVSYAVVCPAITKDVPTPYIQVLTNQRTSFEDILVGAQESAKQSMLAPALRTWLMGLTPQELEEFNKELFVPIEGLDFKADWIKEYLERWIAKALQVITASMHRNIREDDGDMLKELFETSSKNSVRSADISPEKKELLIKEINNRISTEAFNDVFATAFKAALPGASVVGMVPSETTGEISLADAYSSPEKFQQYVAERIPDLIKAIPELEGMLQKYRELGDKEAKAKLAKEIDSLIKERYNAKLVEKTIGSSLENITDANVVNNIPKLSEFMKSPEYGRYVQLARELRFSHGRGRIDVWGGAASRLFGEGQNVDTPLSYAAHDVYDVAVSRDRRNAVRMRQDMAKRGAKFGVSMASRLMIQKWIVMEEEIKRHYEELGIGKTREEIAEERRSMVEKTPRVVIVNAESGESILKEFVDNGHYGHNWELVVFVVQSAYQGIDIQNGKPMPVKGSRPFPGGHGDATMQVFQDGRAFIIDPDGKVLPLKKNAIDYLQEKTDNKVKVFIESRVNDMTKLGATAAEHPELTVNEIDMGIFALALSQMGELDDPATGRNAIMEQVGQDPVNPIKGAQPVNVNGKEFLVEGLAQSPHVAKTINKVGNPFNRFNIFYKAAALRGIKAQGLPVYFRFRDGYLYPETVTGDVTMLKDVNAGWAIEETRQIVDYKDGTGSLKNGVEAAIRQDNDKTFSTYRDELLSDKKDLVISGIEKAPGLGDNGPSVGAIRELGGELTAKEHGPRADVLGLENARRAYKENTVNGIIENKILSGEASAVSIHNIMELRGSTDESISKWSPTSRAGKDLVSQAKKMFPYTSVIFIKGLRQELARQGVAPDLVFHPGITRRVVYADEGDIQYLLSLENGVDLAMEAIAHEVTHIEDYDMPESEVERRSPTYNVRLALALKNVRAQRAKMDIENRQFEVGREYEDGMVYQKPLPKFAKFGTSGVRWLVRDIFDKFKQAFEKVKVRDPGVTEQDVKFAGKYDVLVSNGYTQADFTTPNIGLIAKSIALYNLKKAQGIYETVTPNMTDEFDKRLQYKGLLVFYDNRPGNFEYAGEIARIFTAYGIKVTLNRSNDRFVPVPIAAMSLLIKKEGYAGGIYLTASHNGDEWNGIKFNAEDGAPSSLKVTNAIGSILQEEIGRDKPDFDRSSKAVGSLIMDGEVEAIDAIQYYVDAVQSYIGAKRMAAIKQAIKDKKIAFIYSAFYGSSSNVMKRLCDILGVPEENIIEAKKANESIYTESYEPTLEKLKALDERVKAVMSEGVIPVVIGGSSDNDADRFQVNENGVEYTPARLTPILGHYLVTSRNWRYGDTMWGRSFVSSNYQDYVARLFSQETEEQPTGFKFSPAVLSEGGVIYSEESYGLSFGDWTLDKDGVLPALLALELVANTGKSLSEYEAGIKEELKAKGLRSEFNFERDDKRLLGDVKDRAMKLFTEFYGSIVEGETVFAGKKIVKKYDPAKFDNGMKFVMEDDSWVAVRTSGTEPLIRIYMEDKDPAAVDILRQEALALMELKNEPAPQAAAPGIDEEMSAIEEEVERRSPTENVRLALTARGKAVGGIEMTAAQIFDNSTVPDAEALQKCITSHLLSDTPDSPVVILGYDTAVSSVSTSQVAQAGERSTNKYMNGKLINVRATGSKLLEGIEEAVRDLKDRGVQYKVVIIAGDATVSEVGDGLAKSGKVLNIHNPDNRHIPVIGLYEVALRIAYGSDTEDILASLKRIASNLSDQPLTKADIESLFTNGVLRILPKIRPVNMIEAVEAYKAAQATLVSL